MSAVENLGKQILSVMVDDYESVASLLSDQRLQGVEKTELWEKLRELLASGHIRALRYDQQLKKYFPIAVDKESMSIVEQDVLLELMPQARKNLDERGSGDQGQADSGFMGESDGSVIVGRISNGDKRGRDDQRQIEGDHRVNR